MDMDQEQEHIKIIFEIFSVTINVAMLGKTNTAYYILTTLTKM